MTARLLPKKIFWEPFGLLKYEVRSPSGISRRHVKKIRNLINPLVTAGQ